MGHPLPFPDWKAKEPEKPIEDPTIAAYAAGDTVEPFTLPGRDGKPIALAQIATPYLLIDFWASWCGPCRREVPHLKEAAGKSRDVLTVLAVSLDEDAEAWRKAICEDGSEGLVHVLLARNDAQFKRIVQRFSVKAIPTDFLLDAERRIVAVDLRGDALAAKMDSLTGRQGGL